MMPGNAKGRHVVVEERMKALALFAEDCPYNRVELKDRKIGVITAGICYQYVTEALPQASVLKLGLVNHLPTKLIQDFAKEVDTLIVTFDLALLRPFDGRHAFKGRGTFIDSQGGR